MKILLIEDDPKIARFVSQGLSQEGFRVTVVTDGEAGFVTAGAEPFALAVVDVMLPGRDGLSLVRALRGKGIRLPVLMLSAKRSLDERVAGLNAGADDYLVKPFAFSELLARIQALLRRSQNLAEIDVLKAAGLTLDLKRRKAFRDGEEIVLQPLEYQLLAFLVRNAGRVVSKTMIMENVWDYNFDPQTNVVEARICRLRDKVERTSPKKLIHTVKGAGYVLEER
jgi:two-component system, OmpR family, response regulator